MAFAQSRVAPRRRVVRPSPEAVERLSRLLFAIAGLAAYATLLYLGRGVTFFQDEWRFIDVAGPYGTPYDWIRPHNEHWSTLAFLLYRTVFLAFGLSTYLPYLAALLALHLLAATAVYVLLERRNGAPVALGGGLLVLLVGTGYQNLFWAFQIGFVGSTAAGLWALVAFECEGRRANVAGLLLVLAALMTSGMGLVVAVTVGIDLIADPARRRRVAWLVPAAATYLAWFLVFGRSGVSDGRDPLTLAAIMDVPRFAWSGLVAAVGATTGGITPLAIAGALVLLAAPVTWVVTRWWSPRAVAALAGILTMYALIGLTRGHLGEEQVTRSRYLYEGVILVVLAGSGLLGRRLAPGAEGRLPPPTAAGLAAVLAVLLVLGMAHNASWLLQGRSDWMNRAGETRAYIALLDVIPRAAHDPPKTLDWNIPDPERIRRLIGAHGSPARDALVPWVVPNPTPQDVDRAVFRLVGGGFRVGVPAAGGAGMDPDLDGAGGGIVRHIDRCIVMAPTSARPTITFRLPEGGRLDVHAEGSVTGRTFLHQRAPPQRRNGIELPMGPAGATVSTPRTGVDGWWLVTLHVPAEAGAFTVCPLAAHAP